MEPGVPRAPGCWMKSRWTGLVVACVLGLLAGGCRQASGPPPASPGLRVVCTTFPMYLFTMNVVEGRDNVRVGIMLPAAMGCPHDYVLTPQDMQKLAGADLLIANGLGLEEFLGEPLAKANPRIRIVEASRDAGDVMWTSEAGAAGTGDKVPNPHMFASPRLAAAIVRNIARALADADPAGAAVFARNAEVYGGKLAGLATRCEEATRALASRRIVTEHAVFDYFARDCGLEIVAVVEETPGQEPSAARMLQLVSVIKRTGATALFTEPQYPVRVGLTIAREAGIPAGVLDPVASGPDEAPLDYYERAMRRNFETLRSTLK
jgi:zinc transport system substrate-binding protein